MPLSDRDKLNRIEELKTKLFSKNYQTRVEHRNSFSHLQRKDIPDSWESSPKENYDSVSSPDKLPMKTSLFKNFFLGSLAFFIATLGFAAYVFFAGGNSVSNNNIDISVVGNNFAPGGEDLPLIIGITNRNDSALNLVDLVVEYPKGSPEEGIGGVLGTERSRVSLGTIPAGAERNENLKVVLFGEQGAVRTIKISIEYRIEGSNAIFVKEKTYDVSISSTPLNILVDAPLSVSSNQEIVLNVKAILNANNPISSMLLKLDYPIGFKFESANIKPTFGENIWELGDFAPGEEKNLVITGKMLDVFEGEEKSFHISAGSQSLKDKSMVGVVLNSLTHTVMVQKPILEARILVNSADKREHAVSADTPIRGEIEWTNNLDTKISNLVIRAKISGNAVNRSSIKVERGFYNSSDHSIIWDKNSVQEFGEINPGESGFVRFTLSPLPLFSTSGIITDPSVLLEVSISGRQPNESYETDNLANSDSAIVRIISDVGLATKALHFSGPFANTGPVPLKVEEETTFTVTWSLSNTANHISKGVVKATLPSWVRFAEVISPEKEALTYNSFMREVTWNIGNIPRGTGMTQADRQVSFKVGLTPSLSQVGITPIIINETTLTGHDDFANVDIQSSKSALRTQLLNDPLFPQGGGVVVK